jgi:hypothetical protein
VLKPQLGRWAMRSRQTIPLLLIGQDKVTVKVS